MIQIECLRTEDELVGLKSDWNRLTECSVMRGHSWAMSWLESYRNTHSPYVLVARESERVCGILPLAATLNSWTGQTLEFIGSGKVCTDEQDILCVRQNTASVAEAFGEYLCASHLHASPDTCSWDHLSLDGVSECNTNLVSMLKSMERNHSVDVSAKPGPHCWSVSLPKTWEDYKKTLTKRARKLLNQAEAEVTSQRSCFEIAKSLDQAREFLIEIEALHQSRWKERNIVGCFGDKAFQTFLQSVVTRSWAEPNCKNDHLVTSDSNSKIWIGLLRIDGKPASGTVCFREPRSIAMYLTGMNPEFSELRPGWQITACFLQRAIAEDVGRFDFLRGDEEYKGRLGATPTGQRRWLVTAPRRISKIRGNVYRTASEAKRWLSSLQWSNTQSELAL